MRPATWFLHAFFSAPSLLLFKSLLCCTCLPTLMPCTSPAVHLHAAAPWNVSACLSSWRADVSPTLLCRPLCCMPHANQSCRGTDRNIAAHSCIVVPVAAPLLLFCSYATATLAATAILSFPKNLLVYSLCL